MQFIQPRGSGNGSRLKSTPEPSTRLCPPVLPTILKSRRRACRNTARFQSSEWEPNKTLWAACAEGLWRPVPIIEHDCSSSRRQHDLRLCQPDAQGRQRGALRKRKLLHRTCPHWPQNQDRRKTGYVRGRHLGPQSRQGLQFSPIP